MTDLTAQQLFDKCAEIIKDVPEAVEAYPAGMTELPDNFLVAGRGFFPVASGSFHDGSINSPIGPRKIMFIGQDWGAKESLGELTDKVDGDLASRTCKELIGMLLAAAIPLEECFFTNALFGVRIGKKSTGRSPGWKSPSFVGQCAKALQLQMKTTQPKTIVCLGLDAPQLFATLFPECKVWHAASGFKEIDGAEHGTLKLASNSGPTMAAILLHPSFRAVNARYRNCDSKPGLCVEAQILREIWAHANQ